MSIVSLCHDGILLGVQLTLHDGQQDGEEQLGQAAAPPCGHHVPSSEKGLVKLHKRACLLAPSWLRVTQTTSTLFPLAAQRLV